MNVINRNKREKEIIIKQKIILQQDLNIKTDKINNLYQSLNLKIETEKAFLTSLKNKKKHNSIEGENLLKELLWKINNLIHIDKKSYYLMNESSLQNEQFLSRLSEKFPKLTNFELKLCVYFQLDLSSKEISLFKNTTPNTIRVYKSRIKTKMGLSRETTLNLFLKKFDID